MTTRLVLFTLGLLGLCQTKSFSQIYQYTNDAGGVPAFVDPGVSAGNLTPNGVVLSGTCGPTQGFGTQGWPVTNVFNDNGPNIEFTITPNVDKGLKITGFSTRSRRENLTGTPPDGPIAMRYGYSINNGPWVTINPGNPQSSNLCVSGGVLRTWDPAAFPINTSFPIRFRIYGLSSGSDLTGDFYLRDVIVNGEVCANAPNIVLGTFPTACFSLGSTLTALPYTSSTGTEYIVDFDAAANLAGFVDDLVFDPLLSSPNEIPITIPAGVVAATYHATITVRNGCGFADPTPESFTITVNALPIPSISVTESSGLAPNDGTICQGSSATLTASGGASYVWSTGGTTASIVVSPSTTSSYTVTVTSEGGCTATASRTITVTPVLATANAGPDQILGCDNGTVLISGMIGPPAVSGTWTSSIGGGSFSPSETSLSTYYTPPSGNTTPFTLTLTTNGTCPASNALLVTYGEPDPLVLTVTGPANATCGDEIVFSIVAVSGFSDITSLQYKIDWDEALLEYVSSAGTPIGGSPPGIGDLATGSGELTYVWFNATGEYLPVNSVLLTISLKVVSNTGSPSISIFGDMVVPIEAGTSQFCFLEVNTSEVSVELSPIDVDCPVNQTVCLNTSAFALTGGIPSGGTYSGTGVSGNMFNPATAGVGVHTITYTYTDINDCTNSCTFSITVVEIPVGSAIPSALTMCTGAATSIALSSSVPSTTFGWVASVTAGVVSGQANGSGNSIAQTLTGDGIVRYRITPTGPGPTFCVGSFFDVFVTVKPSAQFAFSASSTSNPVESGDNDPNTLVPSTISVDFCAGDNLTLSGYSDNGAVGYTGYYTTTGNTTYNGGDLGAGPVNFAIPPGGAAGFFGAIYGPYGLSSGTYGSITQVFTPYLDVNLNGSYDAGTDCLGDPMTLIYNIYGPIVVNVTRNANNLCSGEQVNYSISTTSTENVLFDLTLSDNPTPPAGASPKVLAGENSLPIVMNGLSVNSMASTPFLQTINNATGTFDRGRVLLTISNVRYANSDVACSVTVNNTQPNTTIYPEPRLAAPVDKLICTNNSTALDIDLDPSSLPSLNAANAGFDVGIEWTITASTNVAGFSNSLLPLTIHTSGGGDVSNTDIAQVLTLVNPMAVGTVTYQITPRSMGPGGGYNGNDCIGNPITIIVTVVPKPVPTIAGPTCVHVSAQMQLTATPNILPPAAFVSGVWTSTIAATVDVTGLVTGVTPGPAIITYTVTDNAGCSSSATYSITVLGPLTLTSTTTASTVGCGEEFTVSVAVTNFCDVGTLDYNFEWDENLFQFVTHSTINPLSIPSATVSVNTLSVGSGELYFSIFDNGIIPPYSLSLAPNTVILTYTLRAIGNAGTYGIPSSIILESASNSNLSTVPVTSTGVDIEIEALSLSLLGNPDVCPSDNNAYLEFDPMAVQGNPNYYFIDFDGCPGFPDTQEGPLVLIDGQIVIPLPPLFVSGSCSGTLVVSNTTYGCESGVINFFILNDDDDPEVPTPAPITQQCFPAPAPNTNVVVGETDLCTDVEDLIVAYQAGLSTTNGGTGCSGNPLVISRVYSVTDEAGNTTYVTQTITIEDNIDPFLLNPPTLAVWYPSESAAITAAMTHANLNKRDNCTPQVGITVAQSTVPTYVGCTVTIHLVLTDACGNITLVDYTTVVDDENPSIDLLLLAPIDDCYSEADFPVAPYFSYRDAVEAAIAAVTAVANDNCTDPEDLVITATTSGTDCNLNIIVSVADACGRTTTYTYNTRVESDGPFIPANPLALEGECFNTVEEAEDAAIALAMVGAGDDCTSPNDLQYDVMTNPGCPADIMVVVTDFCGNPSTITFTGVHIDILDPTVSVESYGICFKTLSEALASLSAAANAEDNCTATEDLVLTHSEVEVAPTGDACRIYNITLTFTDNCTNAVSTTFSNITLDNVLPTITPLSTLTYACFDEIDEPNTSLVVATDNCTLPAQLDIDWISDNLPVSCPGTGTRRYRVTDCAGNSRDVVQPIVVNDNVKPTFTTVPSDDLDRSIPCGDPIALQAANDLEPEFEDNCGEPYVIKTSGPFVTGECPQSGTYTNTWRAYDDCGNSSSAVFTQVITVYDNVPPVVNFGCMFAPFLAFTSDGADCPTEAGTSLEVGDVLHPTDTWMVAGIVIPSLQGCVSDNCASESEINIEVISIDVDNIDCSRTISITFEISDACGNANPMPFVCEYLIIDDVDPIWETPEGAPFPTGIDVTIDCDDVAELAFANSLAPEASDDCSAVELFKTTGLFVPGVDCPQEGTFTNTWTAEDDCGNTSLVFTQTITVIDNAGPVWITLPLALNASVSCSNPGALAAAQLLAPIAEDNCDGSVSPLKNAGLLVPGNCPGTGTITNTWTVTDDCGNISTMYTQMISIIDNTPPTATGESIAACYSTAAAAQAAAIAETTGMDNCSSVTKTAATTGACSAVVTVTVTDCAGNTATKTYATRIDDTKPTLVPSTLTVTCYPTLGDAQAAIYTATMISDNCSDIEDIDILYSNTGACPTTSITMTATDECGNSRSITYNGLCIGSGSSVMITTPATPGTATCTNEVTALAAWLANHGGAVATGSGVIWTYPPVVFGAINCMTHSKVATVVFTATDGCGYTAQTTSTFTVSDNTPPTANMIANTNLSCTNVIPVPDVNLVTGEADNCGGTPTVTVGSTTDNLASGCPASPRVITHQYIVTDSYCNTAAVNHLIMIVDNVKPTFTAPINATISVNASCVYIASTATTGDVTNEADNCTSSGPGLQAIYTDVVAAGPMGANPKFIITRTWTLVDACGNTAIPRTQTITVNDNTVPTITGCPSNLTLPGGTIEGQCGSYFGAQAAPSIADNCSGATLSYALSGVSPGMGTGNVPNGTIFNEGVTTVTYTVRDAVGNTATCSFTVTVNCTTVEGRIVWEHNGAGVNTATVSLAPTAPLVTDLTDAAGDYSLAAPGPGNFTITPVKNNGGAAGRLNGVDAADVLAIQNHVNGMAVIMNPYKKVCADVNRSNVITNQDATTITQAIAGVPAALLAFNVFWRFVPKPPAFVWPPAGNNVIPPFPENIAVLVAGADILGQDFIGMKIGDVNGTANPATAPMAPLVWVLQDQTLVAGTEIELEFATANFNNLAAYQFGLDFDPTQLQFVNFQSLGALPMNMVDNFGAYHADLGELRTIWTASNSMGRTLTDGTSVFRAKFKVLASGQKLSQVLRLDDSQIECKAYSQALAPTEVKIVFAESVGTDTPLDLGNAQLQLMQNRPNPFSDATTIGFILPEACDAHIRILDISGRELTTYDRTYTAGYHELDFRMENAWSYGVLFCELVTPQGKRMIKMITSK